MNMPRDYHADLQADSKEFNIAFAVWKFIKKCDTEEERRLVNLLLSALSEGEGSAEELKPIFVDWWNYFCHYYWNDDSERYWTQAIEWAGMFYKKYWQDKNAKVALKLADGTIEFQRWRRDNGLLQRL